MLGLDEILAQHPVRFVSHFQFLNVPVTVKSNSQALSQCLDQYFARWLTAAPGGESHLAYALIAPVSLERERLADIPRRPGKAVKEAAYDADECRVVLKKRTGVVVYQRGGERYIVGDLLAHISQVVNVINELYIRGFLNQGYLLLHAAGVVSPEGWGTVFASDSGSGKSTMAVAMLERGFRFLSNDRVLVKAVGDSVDLLGVPKMPRINPGSILALSSLQHLLTPEEREHYLKLGREDLWRLEHKFDIDVDGIYGPGTFILQARLRSVYLLDWSLGGGDTAVTSLSPSQSREGLLPNVINLNPLCKEATAPEPARHELGLVTEMVGLFRVTGGVNLDALCRAVLSRHTHL